MKSQTLLLQFLLFFIIGLTILSMLGNFFSIHTAKSEEYLEEDSMKAVSSLISTYILNLISLNANSSNITLYFSNFSRLKDFEISLKKEEIVIRSPKGIFVESPIHKLGESTDFEGTKNLLFLTFTYDKEKNKLEIR